MTATRKKAIMEGNDDVHVDIAAFKRSGSSTVLEEFNAVFERVIEAGSNGPITVPIACAKLLKCRCEENNATHSMAIFARNPDGGGGKLIVSLPLTGSFEATQLPHGALLLRAPPAPFE